MRVIRMGITAALEVNRRDRTRGDWEIVIGEKKIATLLNVDSQGAFEMLIHHAERLSEARS